MSSLFLDRPMSPMDTAVYWIEYAARHGNVLKSPGSELSWWQNYFFDIYVFCTICILFIIYIIQMLCKLLLKLLNIRKIKNTSSQSKTRGKKNK